MKITAKLAYSQLKINRSRTVWTLLGVVLSTALITAVCSLAASANAMLIGLLGQDYGNYRQSMVGLLFVPAILFCLIIVAMSVVVVSNVFRISASERTTQFGILKSTGATKKQIMETVMYESIWVCLVAIPIGIIAGLLLALAGSSVANYFLDELNTLVHMMMTEIVLVVDFVFSWKVLVIAAGISFFTVLLSAWIPANKAAKITAMEGIRGIGEITLEVQKRNTSPLIAKLFGFEGTMAVKNWKRNRRVFRATVISLTVGVVLFINLSALGRQANELEDLLTIDVDASVMSEYSSNYSTRINEKTGREEIIYTRPIDSRIGNEVTKKLREYENTRTYGIGTDMETYEARIPREQITTDMLEALSYPEGEDSYEFSVEINTVDDKNYLALCEQMGVPVGSVMLLNQYTYNDNGRKVNIAPFLLEGKPLQLLKADGTAQEVIIQCVLNQEEIPEEFFALNSRQVQLILPQAEVRSYSCYSDPVNVEGFMEYANVVMDEFFVSTKDAAYMEEGFNTRVYKLNDYMRVMNMAIVVVSIFLYSFVALLILIGLTNVISTMSTNVLMRSREFAVLQSVGMTSEGIKRMLNMENFLCSAKALLLGLPIALLGTYLINLPIRAMFPIPYEIPWLAILICICTVFFIVWITTRFAAYKLRDRNIIEAIHSESGK